MCDEAQSIVIDCGSSMCRAGFASVDEPKTIFPTVVTNDAADNTLIGSDAHQNLDNFTLRYPIQNSVVTNWGDFEKTVSFIYKELEAAPENFSLLMSEPHLNAKENKEKMLQLMFEKFQVPSMQTISQTVLSMYANGRTTGIVVDCGDGPSHIVPIYDGFAYEYGVVRLPYGGYNLTKYLQEMFTERGINLPEKNALELMKAAKEKCCRVSFEFENDLKAAAPIDYQLPDGNVIKLGNEVIQCPELLFRPLINGIDAEGVHKALYASIMKCDCSIRKELYKNIILSGGSTLTNGFIDRLRKELVALIPPQLDLKIIPPQNDYTAWLGGSVLVSLGSFKGFCIQKQQFEEYGMSVLNRFKFSN